MKKIYDLKKRLKKMEIKKLNTVLIIGLFLVLAQASFAAVTLTRDLPTSKAAGSTFTVSLALNVVGPLPGIGIVENYPSGWTVSSISNGGVQKSGPSRIEWILFTGGNITTQTLTYSITVPANASGTATFSGTYSTDSEGTIAGDTSMTITGATTTTVATTTTTTLPQYPAYATRSMSSSSVKAGGSLTVTLSLQINESNKPNAVGVTENIPSGWTVSSISPNGTYSSSSNKIEWLFWTNGNPVEDTTISYTITVPSGTSTGAKTFSGDVDYGGSTNPEIYGQTQVTVVKKSSSRDEFTVTLPTGTVYANTPVAVVVTDLDSKDPVKKAGVDVFLGTDNNGQKVAYGITDENGTFKFTPATAGQYTIYVDMSRYKEAKATLTVVSGAPTTAPTTTVVTTTQKVTTMPVTTTMPVVTTTRKTTTTTPITTQATTTQPQATTTLGEVTTTTQPTGTDSGSNMLLIGIIVIIIIAAVVFFMMKGKKGKPAENGKKGKEEKASKPSEAKE
jgi:hypothetical protein